MFTDERGLIGLLAGERDRGPAVVAHRGASGYRKEHTRAAYELAARQGADIVETDVVPTKDGVLLCRHEPDITHSTDVADHPRFANRKRPGPSGTLDDGFWLVQDFTVDELGELQAREPRPDLRPENADSDDPCGLVTLQELIDLQLAPGLIVEAKHLALFAALDLDVEPMLVEILERNGLNRPDANVAVSSFDVAPLRSLASRLEVPIIQNIDVPSKRPGDFALAGDPRTYRDLLSDEGLREIARYAAAIVPERRHIVPRDAQGYALPATDLVERAHAAKLPVVPYAVARENAALPRQFRRGDDPSGYGDAAGELALYRDIEVDGVVTDHPDLALEAFGRRAIQNV